MTRHGETHENVKKISMGQGVDGILNEQGIEQAKKLANRLKDERIDFAYISDLKRAIDTAEEILKFHSRVEAIHTPYLRERNLGVYEGGPNTVWKEVMQKSSLPFHSFQPQGGESYSQLQERVGKFFDELLSKHGSNSVLLVSHTGALTMLLLKILGKDITRENYEEYKPGNTAVTICDVTPEGSSFIRILNSIEHLEKDICNAE